MITALLEIARITKDHRYFDFAESFIDHFVNEDGTILTFKPEKYNLDDIDVSEEIIVDTLPIKKSS